MIPKLIKLPRSGGVVTVMPPIAAHLGHDRLYSIFWTLMKKRKFENDKLLQEREVNLQQQSQPQIDSSLNAKFISLLIRL